MCRALKRIGRKYRLRGCIVAILFEVKLELNLSRDKLGDTPSAKQKCQMIVLVSLDTFGQVVDIQNDTKQREMSS